MIPDFNTFCEHVDEIYWNARDMMRGKVSRFYRESNTFMIPDFNTFCEHVDVIYWNARDMMGGKVSRFYTQKNN